MKFVWGLTKYFSTNVLLFLTYGIVNCLVVGQDTEYVLLRTVQKRRHLGCVLCSPMCPLRFCPSESVFEKNILGARPLHQGN